MASHKREAKQAEDNEALRQIKKDCKTFTEIQDMHVGDMIFEKCKYFGFCTGATSKLIKDIIKLGKDIAAWDKHLDKHADGNYGCSCEDNGDQCPPLPTWCTTHHLSTFRVKAAKGASDSSRKRRKLLTA